MILSCLCPKPRPRITASQSLQLLHPLEALGRKVLLWAAPAAARGSHQDHFQPGWLWRGRKTPGLGMEQTVTCGWGRSHEPGHTWCQRFDPALPFPLFLPPAGVKEDAAGRCLLQDNPCVHTFLLFLQQQQNPGQALQVSAPSCCVPKDAPGVRDNILDTVEDDRSSSS